MTAPAAQLEAFAPFEQDEAFKDLRRLMASPRPPLALVGAGASVGSGYPDWSGLLRQLKAVAMDRRQASAWRKDVDDLNDALWTAEVLTREMDEGGLSTLIAQAFGPHRPPGEPHLTLARMPFPHVLTTNYDCCIERALKGEAKPHRPISWRQEAAVANFLIGLGHPDSERTVLHLHGRWDETDDDIVLTESDYVARYIASDDARRKLMAVFMTHPVVFVGFSMNDPDLANLMREVTARLKIHPPRHYALLGYKHEGERQALRDRMEGKFGVRPVFFSLIPNKLGGADAYGNLLHLLDALAGFPPRKLEPAVHTRLQPRFDPEDPNKGRFGGLAQANGRRLSVRKDNGSQADEGLALTFAVEALPGSEPLDGPVSFFLHPTFSPKVATVQPRGGKAALERWAYGAFTIGAQIAGETTQLELDLAAEPSLPLWFRRR